MHSPPLSWTTATMKSRFCFMFLITCGFALPFHVLCFFLSLADLLNFLLFSYTLNSTRALKSVQLKLSPPPITGNILCLSSQIFLVTSIRIIGFIKYGNLLPDGQTKVKPRRQYSVFSLEKSNFS